MTQRSNLAFTQSRLRWRTTLAVIALAGVVGAACSSDDSSSTVADSATTVADTTAETVAETVAEAAATTVDSADNTTPVSDPSSTDPGSAEVADDPLIVLNSYEIAFIDPVASGGFWLYDFGGQENLLERKDDGKLHPWIAESVERVDPLTWTITVRDGITYGNGGEVDAEGVAASINRQIAERSGSRNLIPGGVATVSGPLEVMLTTPEPNAGVADALAERGAFPVYDVDAVVAADGVDEDTFADNDLLIGTGFLTGPYQPVEFSADEMTLGAYADYWQGTPPLPGVVVRRVIDEQARMLAVQNGEADLNLYPPVEAARLLTNADGPQFKASTIALQGVTMDLNLQSAPFDDVKVRQALALALDYDMLANDVLDGVFGVATGLYPEPVVPGIVERSTTDPERASALLDEAGWVQDGDGVRTRGGEKLSFTILRAAQDPETNSLAIAIQELVKPFGFEVELLTSEDFFTVLEDPEAWDATIFLTGLMSSSGAPYGPFFNKLTTEGPNNNGKFSDPELDALYLDLLASETDDERLEILDRTSEIVVTEQAYLIITTFKRYVVVVSPEYSDYVVSNFRRHVTFDTAPAA